MELYEDDSSSLSEDDILNAAMDLHELNQIYEEARHEQRRYQRHLIEQSGGQINPNTEGRFVFDLQPLQRQTNRRYGIQERNYEVRLRQEGNVIDRLAPAIRDAMQRSVEEVLNNDRIPDSHQSFFDLFSNRLAAGTYRSNGMTVGDWRHNPERVDTIFENLQQTLNSNEDFAMDDSFHMEITTVAPVYRQVRGRRHRRKKVTYQGIDQFLIKNKSVILIKNQDNNLCAAHAIIASKATQDYPAHHPMRRKLAKDDKRTSDVHQKSAAIMLHETAQVPQDVAVGADELKAFQNVLPQYRLICVYAGRGHDAVAFSPHDPDKKQIVIVHVDDHYHACSSLKGYRQNNHVCPYCLKGYDDQGQHRCVSEENVKFCLCCRREDCKEFQQTYPQGVKPQMKCGSCGRYFYGERCYRNHLTYSLDGKVNPDNCLCVNIRRCHKGKKLNRSKQDIKNRCGFATCPTCSDYVKLEDHRCYIESSQKVREKRKAVAMEKKAQKKAKQAAAAAEADPDSDVEPVDLAEELIEEFEQGEMLGRNPDSDHPKERQPPIHVWFDIEARQESGIHVANLLVYQDDGGNKVILRGESCIEEFIKDLKKLTEQTQRRLIVIAHNLQSYDGYFIIKEMYKDGKQLTQIRNGAKILRVGTL